MLFTALGNHYLYTETFVASRSFQRFIVLLTKKSPVPNLYLHKSVSLFIVLLQRSLTITHQNICLKREDSSDDYENNSRLYLPPISDRTRKVSFNQTS